MFVRLPWVCLGRGIQLVREQEIGLRHVAASFAAEGVVSVNVVFVMATFARGPVWVDGESKFAADAEKEC